MKIGKGVFDSQRNFSSGWIIWTCPFENCKVLFKKLVKRVLDLHGTGVEEGLWQANLLGIWFDFPLLSCKLDGVGHIVTHDTWHRSGDRWEEVNLLSKFQLPSSYSLGVTGDMWHMTCDTWHVTGMGRLTFSQNFSSLGLAVWEWRFIENIQSYFHKPSLNQLISQWQRWL